MKVVFLDIDGVLNRLTDLPPLIDGRRDWERNFHPPAVAALNDLLRVSGARKSSRCWSTPSSGSPPKTPGRPRSNSPTDGAQGPAQSTWRTVRPLSKSATYR